MATKLTFSNGRWVGNDIRETTLRRATKGNETPELDFEDPRARLALASLAQARTLLSRAQEEERVALANAIDALRAISVRTGDLERILGLSRQGIAKFDERRKVSGHG